MKKRKRSYSMTRYWVILVCWFFSPLVLSMGFGVVLPGGALEALIALYWVFVMVTAICKQTSAKWYLEKNHPYEARVAKLRYIPSAWPPPVRGQEPFWDYFRRNPPPGDEEWLKMQKQLDQFLIYIAVSFGAAGAFAFLYLILGAAGLACPLPSQC